LEGDKARVGYNAWAADAAGKLVSIKTRPAGRSVKAGKTLGSIESGKWVGSLKAPLSGEILEINPKLAEDPSIINQDPYGEGWVALLKPTNLEAEIGELIKGSSTLEEASSRRPRASPPDSRIFSLAASLKA